MRVKREEKRSIENIFRRRHYKGTKSEMSNEKKSKKMGIKLLQDIIVSFENKKNSYI